MIPAAIFHGIICCVTHLYVRFLWRLIHNSIFSMGPITDNKQYATPGELRQINHLLPAEYLLVLSPHQALWDEIKTIKEKFAKDYDCETAKRGLPHITLIAFRQMQTMERQILPKLRSIANTLSPFKVELKGFGSFPSHTIYINITSKVEIVNAVKALRAPQKFMKLDKENKPHI